MPWAWHWSTYLSNNNNIYYYTNSHWSEFLYGIKYLYPLKQCIIIEHSHWCNSSHSQVLFIQLKYNTKIREYWLAGSTGRLRPLCWRHRLLFKCRCIIYLKRWMTFAELFYARYSDDAVFFTCSSCCLITFYHQSISNFILFAHKFTK